MAGAIIFLIILVGAVIIAFVLFSRRINSAWTTAAEDLGLRVTEGGISSGPGLEGTVDSFHVDVITIPEPVNGSTLTQVTVSFPPLGTRFTLQPVDGRSASSDDLDSRLTIDTDDPALADSALPPALRDTLARLADIYPSLTATDTELSVLTSGTVTRAETIVTMVRDLVETAGDLTTT